MTRLAGSRTSILACVLLMGIAVLLSLPVARKPVKWSPDALVYQAQILELRGMSREAEVVP